MAAQASGTREVSRTGGTAGMGGAPGTGVRLAEVVAALSLATDLAYGQPMEHALRATLLATDLGQALALSDRELRDVYYLTLLCSLGCAADAHRLARWLGDEIAAAAELLTSDPERPAEMLKFLLRHVGAGQGPLRRAWLLGAALATGQRKGEEVAVATCEVGQQLAAQLGFGSEIQLALGQVCERWDGDGTPGRARGEAIALPVRVARVARQVEIAHRLGGVEGAVAAMRRHAGGLLDPALTERFQREAPRVLARLGAESVWDAVLAAEPAPQMALNDAQLDTALRAVAMFVDLRSPALLGHSAGVATLAAAAAQRYGLPQADATSLHRAGLVHDIGRVGVPAAIWEKAGPLADGEWERVRLHPYLTERILARPAGLAKLGALASLHHERLDGSGYHRSIPASLQPPAARILAAADAYHAMTEPRPHRAPHAPEAASEQLRRAARDGQFDYQAVEAVLAAAGQRGRPANRELPAGLSAREVEVLRLISRGLHNRQIGERLFISQKTVGHHIQHIYDKIGVSTRPAATLFALRHDLLDEAVAEAA